VNGRHRNMECIDPGLRRQTAADDQPLGQNDRVLRDLENGHVHECCEPPGCCLRVASCSFVKNELRGKQFEGPSTGPPIASHLLVRGQDEVPTWPRGQVADNRCLDVGLGLHEIQLISVQLESAERAASAAAAPSSLHAPPSAARRVGPPVTSRAIAAGVGSSHVGRAPRSPTRVAHPARPSQARLYVPERNADPQ